MILFYLRALTNVYDVVMETLEEFGEVWGQMISINKSQLFVSPNVLRSKKNEFHFRCHIPLIENLGKYKPIPLVYSKVNKQTFVELLEKTKKCLSG